MVPFDGNNLDNGIDDLKEQTRRTVHNLRTRRSVKKAGKKIAKGSGKAVKSIGRVLGKFFAWLGGLGAPFIIPVICVVLVVVIIYMSIAGLFNQAYLSLNSSTYTLTEDAELIIELFEAYAKEIYRTGKKTVDNVDDERDKYKAVLDYIEDNKYEYELAGIWSVVVEECMSEVLYQTEKTITPQGYKNAEDAYKSQSYPSIIGDYYEEVSETGQGSSVEGKVYYIGFRTGSVAEYEDRYDRSFHWYLTNHLFKVCLDAFVNDDGSYIDLSDVTTTVATTASNSDSNTNLSTGNSFGYNDDSSELTELVYNNLIRAMHNRPTYVTKDDNGNEKTLSTVFDRVAYYYTDFVSNSGLNTSSSDAEVEKVLEESANGIKNKIKNVSSAMLNYNGGGTLEDLEKFAKQEVGNGGKKYCDYWSAPMNDWCAYFAGWLLEKGCGVRAADYGWSAGVGTWCDALKVKNKYHMLSETTYRGGKYKVKAGDIIFFGTSQYYRQHVGIVINVSDNTITTAEGNTGSNNFNTSTVQIKEYDVKNGWMLGFGDVTISNYKQVYKKGSPYIYGGYKVDPNYQGQVYKLTDKERTEIERIVTGEFGNCMEGALLIAQCLRDALVYGEASSPLKIRKEMGYDGYNTNVSDTAKQAVNYIFDQGGMAVKHRIYVMYATYISSPWHETQNFVYEQKCEHGDVRFFDFW